MKEQVLRIIQNDLRGSEDNLYRANMQFGKNNYRRTGK